MGKIGILTFHRPNNFGAVLQAYALQKILSENGIDCEIVDYRNKQIEKNHHYTSLKVKAINTVLFFINHSYHKNMRIRDEKFGLFRKTELRCSHYYKNAEEFCRDYNKIIVGSDQVWNLKLTNNDMTYFLPYKHGAVKLTYAASFGSSHVIKEMIFDRHLLRDFKSLLVREDESLQYLIANITPNARKVIDPTFLLSKERWCELSKPYFRAPAEKYIVLYFVAPYTNALELARTLAKRNGLVVYWLDPGRHEHPDTVCIKDIGPNEFLWFIKNAEYVITTSYHGLILSLNLNVKFLFELNHSNENNANSRLYDVMNMFNLGDYQITSADISKYVDLCYNWMEINSRIEDERTKSKKLLLDSLYEEVYTEFCEDSRT